MNSKTSKIHIVIPFCIVGLGVISSLQESDPIRSEQPVKEKVTPSQFIKTPEKETPKLYHYKVRVETIPENYILKLEKSGYNQFKVRNLGESNSVVYYEFTHTEQLSIKESWEYISNNPDKITIIKSQKEIESFSEIDYFMDNYEQYLEDPEDIITYPEEIFDFWAD